MKKYITTLALALLSSILTLSIEQVMHDDEEIDSVQKEVISNEMEAKDTINELENEQYLP